MGLRCALAGTSEGTRESKEFKCELAFLDFTAPSDPVDRFIVKILQVLKAGT